MAAHGLFIRITARLNFRPRCVSLEAIDEISIVAAPGTCDPDVRDAIRTHCENNFRFGILDTPETVKEPPDSSMLSPDSKNLAMYFPWIEVFDPGTKIMDPKGTGKVFVPPSGHMAGIYARVDTNRGVHKAPANER